MMQPVDYSRAIPTDSLYKFLTIGGTTLVVAASLIDGNRVSERRENFIELRAEMAAIKKEYEVLKFISDQMDH